MLLAITERGLFCEAGNFYIDPLRPVETAVITHAHADHARPGSRLYLTEETGKAVLQSRLGPEARIESLRYGQSIARQGVNVSLHPAGHILGSAQVRIEYKGEICVVSGDYKLANDGTCPAFEPIRCHWFVTESTFGLPIYRWPDQSRVFDEIRMWWRENQSRGRTSVVFCYALGKAQRLLRNLDAGVGPIFLHGAIDRYLPAYQEAGVVFPSTTKLPEEVIGRGLVLAPMSADNTPWLRKFGEVSTAFASGWMQIRGARRRRSVDRGFVLSDHVDWPGLLDTINATGAETVWVTHGYAAAVARWLGEQGKNARGVVTLFEGDAEGDGD